MLIATHSKISFEVSLLADELNVLSWYQLFDRFGCCVHSKVVQVHGFCEVGTLVEFTVEMDQLVHTKFALPICVLAHGETPVDTSMAIVN